ncbi:AI-2E family transporter, partial [Escherichia coli]|uniref:AI-2E family transporter n=1 Tax=Escherichia coli TaxID=562 RepID=UPI00200C82DE
VPAYGPQNDVTLKMPAFEWVHVQLHQQKGMISLSPPTICNSALPRNRGLAGQVWKEMNQQITNYIRGKVLEMIVVGIATWLGFLLFGLNYSLLLAVLVGFSVLIPYIGAFVVTIPVIGVALFQFGAGTEFWSCFAVYLIIQALDGNLLVPVLFSEAVNLHPLVIILSVVIFGGLWGFWGVFFAIPLATLIKAVIHAWPDGQIAQE